MLSLNSIAAAQTSVVSWGPDTTRDSIYAGTITTTVRKDTTLRLGLPKLQGVAFGAANLLNNDYCGVMTLSQDGVASDNILAKIAKARTCKVKLLLNPAGGGHSRYITNGKWDEAKFRAKINALNTPAIRAAVAQAVADGIIVGASVMDEPQQEDAPGNEEKSWGPHGWMTKAKVDGMCAYVKTIFPTLNVGVVHDASKFYPETRYAICDFLGSQYRESKGDAETFAKQGKAFTDASKMALVLMLNYPHGGTPKQPCPKFDDDNDNLCPMTPEQVSQRARIFGKYACAISGFQYVEAMFDEPPYIAAFKATADALAKLPGKPCRRTG